MGLVNLLESIMYIDTQTTTKYSIQIFIDKITIVGKMNEIQY